MASTRLSEARSALWSARGAQGGLERALILGREASFLDPESVGAFMVAGVALFRLGRVAEAATVLEEVLQLRPAHPTARLWLRRARAAGGDGEAIDTDAGVRGGAATAVGTGGIQIRVGGGGAGGDALAAWLAAGNDDAD